MNIKWVVAASTVALTINFTGAASQATELFTIKSSTFADGKMMPKKVANRTANAPNNPNCVGENVSPQFSCSNVPDGTKSFAFLMIDPEGRAPGGVNHWVAYGIPASVTGFAEGEAANQATNMSAAKAPKASDSIQVHALRPTRRRITTLSF